MDFEIISRVGNINQRLCFNHHRLVVKGLMRRKEEETFRVKHFLHFLRIFLHTERKKFEDLESLSSHRLSL